MHKNKINGIAAMLGAVFCFSLMDASLKQLATAYPTMQVAFLRGVTGLPLLLALAAVRNEWRVLLPARPWLHILRGLLSVVTLYAFVYSIGVLSLADAYSIFLVAPLIATALSVPLLRERVGWRRWIAIAVGLLGAIIMLRPTGAGLLTLGASAALISAFTYALGVVLIRVASRTDTAEATIFWTLFTVAVVAGLLSLRDWVDLQREHWPLIVAMAISGTLGQILITDAFRRCEAGVVVPFEYTALIWGIALDWFIWHVLPEQRMLSGAVIVVGSGLYVIYREHRQGSTRTAAVSRE